MIQPPQTHQDEVRNVQAVIDTLSLDILNTSLSHINGEHIVSGDKQAVSNLLDVFSSLLEYIMERISSDVSSITDNGTVWAQYWCW